MQHLACKIQSNYNHGARVRSNQIYARGAKPFHFFALLFIDYRLAVVNETTKSDKSSFGSV